MAKVTIHYTLSTAGQKASLLAGGNGKASQTLTIEGTASDPILVTAIGMARIDKDGSATLRANENVTYSDCGVPYTYAVSSIPSVTYDAPQSAESLVADEVARRQAFRDKVAAHKVAEDAKKATERAEMLAADPLGEKWLYRHYNSDWGVSSYGESDPEFATIRALAQTERDRRNAEQKAAEVATAAAKEKAKADREAAVTAAKEKLAAWVTAHGSDLARKRLAHNYDCWVTAGKSDYVDAVVDRLCRTLTPCPDMDDYNSDSDDRKCPTLAELDVLDRISDAAKSDPDAASIDVTLERITYTPKADEYDDDDADDKIIRTELCVAVTVFGAWKENRFFLIPGK